MDELLARVYLAAEESETRAARRDSRFNSSFAQLLFESPPHSVEKDS
jgi:hypothetical protein